MVSCSIPVRRKVIMLSCGIVVCLVLGVSEPLSALGVHHAPKPKKTAARDTVEALEEQWRLAQLNGDVAGMDRLLADDFVGITAFGQVTTKAQQLARVRDHVVALTQLDLSDIKVKRIGAIVAVVTSRAEITGTSDGQPMRGTFRYTRVYHKLANGAWKITSFEATRVPTDGSRAARAEAAPPLPPVQPLER